MALKRVGIYKLGLLRFLLFDVFHLAFNLIVHGIVEQMLLLLEPLLILLLSHIIHNFVQGLLEVVELDEVRSNVDRRS